MKKNEALEKEIKTGSTKVQVGRFIDNYTRHAVQRRANCKIPKAAFQMVSKFWKEKRYKIGEGKRPLIRRLLIETEDEKKRQEIELEKRPRNLLLKECSDMEKYLSLRALRTDLERARTAIDVIRQREKKKLERLHLFKTILQQLSDGVDNNSPPSPLTIRIPFCPEVQEALKSLRDGKENPEFYRENKRKANSEIYNDNVKVRRRDDTEEEDEDSKTSSHKHDHTGRKKKKKKIESKSPPLAKNGNIENNTQTNSNMDIDHSKDNINTDIAPQIISPKPTELSTKETSIPFLSINILPAKTSPKDQTFISSDKPHTENNNEDPMDDSQPDDEDDKTQPPNSSGNG